MLGSWKKEDNILKEDKIPKNIFQTLKTEHNINIVYNLSKNNINIKDVEYVQNVPIVIYLVWFGNTISNNRLSALLSIINNIEIPYIIITNKNYLNYEKENFPIHKNFTYLAVNHKSDYMRAYLLFHYGGLYHDIKYRKSKIYKNEWGVFNNYNIWIKSRKEKYKHWIGYNIEDNNTKWIQDYYNILGTMCLVICRPYTEYLFELNNYITKKLDKHSNLLEKFPAKSQQVYYRNTPFELIKDSNVYPLRWLELMGEKFHLLMYKFKNHINLDLIDFEYTNYI